MLTIPWNDGSGDNLYLDINQGTGNSIITITSDTNNGIGRSKKLTFTTIDGNKRVTLTVHQHTSQPRQFIGSDGVYLDITGDSLYEL